METKEIIKELELNYGYKFNPKEKHEFDWICDLIKDVETVVSKNESLHLVSESTLEKNGLMVIEGGYGYYKLYQNKDFLMEGELLECHNRAREIIEKYSR